MRYLKLSMIYKQRILLILFAALFLLSELFPPWGYTDRTSSIKHSAGFHFVGSESEIKSFAEIKERFSLPDRYRQEDFIVRKDLGRLNLQRLSLLLFMSGLLLFFDERKSIYKRLSAVSFILIGLGFTSIWIFYSLR